MSTCVARTHALGICYPSLRPSRAWCSTGEALRRLRCLLRGSTLSGDLRVVARDLAREWEARHVARR